MQPRDPPPAGHHLSFLEEAVATGMTAGVPLHLTLVTMCESGLRNWESSRFTSLRVATVCSAWRSHFCPPPFPAQKCNFCLHFPVCVFWSSQLGTELCHFEEQACSCSLAHHWCLFKQKTVSPSSKREEDLTAPL